MSGNQIGDAGAASLGEATKHLSSLQSLRMSGNRFSDALKARLQDVVSALLS